MNDTGVVDIQVWGVVDNTEEFLATLGEKTITFLMAETKRQLQRCNEAIARTPPAMLDSQRHQDLLRRRENLVNSNSELYELFTQIRRINGGNT